MQINTKYWLFQTHASSCKQILVKINAETRTKKVRLPRLMGRQLLHTLIRLISVVFIITIYSRSIKCRFNSPRWSRDVLFFERRRSEKNNSSRDLRGELKRTLFTLDTIFYFFSTHIFLKNLLEWNKVILVWNKVIKSLFISHCQLCSVE